jgi:hypothetical protein
VAVFVVPHQKVARLEAGRAAAHAQLEASLQQARAQLASAEAKGAALSELKYRHEAELRDLHSRATASDGAAAHAHAGTAALRDALQAAEARAFAAERDASARRLEAAALAQQVVDKEALQAQAELLASAAQEARARCEQEAARLAASGRELQERLRQAAADVKRGNEVWIQTSRAKSKEAKRDAQLPGGRVRRVVQGLNPPTTNIGASFLNLGFGCVWQTLGGSGECVCTLRQQVIERLASEARGLKEKGKAKSECIKQQEAALEQARGVTVAAEQKAHKAQLDSERQAEKCARLEGELGEANRRLADSSALLESNSQTIAWLNQELNETLGGPPTARGGFGGFGGSQQSQQGGGEAQAALAPHGGRFPPSSSSHSHSHSRGASGADCHPYGDYGRARTPAEPRQQPPSLDSSAATTGPLHFSTTLGASFAYHLPPSRRPHAAFDDDCGPKAHSGGAGGNHGGTAAAAAAARAAPVLHAGFSSPPLRPPQPPTPHAYFDLSAAAAGLGRLSAYAQPPPKPPSPATQGWGLSGYGSALAAAAEGGSEDGQLDDYLDPMRAPDLPAY